MHVPTAPRVLRTAVLVAFAAASLAVAPLAAAKSNLYSNPLLPKIAGGGVVESCADPTVIRSQSPADNAWYAVCTTDPLNGADRNASGGFNFRLMPILRSIDLVDWTYVGDVFPTRPGWVADDAGLWAPDLEYFNGRYYLYYTASWTDLPGGGSAIGVATAPSPSGPWTDAGTPAVEPHDADCCPGARRWVFDPDVVETGGQRFIFYGSYFGGISARRLSADGFTSDPATQIAITIANRYEGAHVVQRGGFFYLFGSATDCCRGPLTGYSVFVGRSASLLGPYVDRDGASLLAGRAGGTPVLSMNGNRWVGTGHVTSLTDFAGQDWMLYHAVDRNDPYFTGAVGFTKRPLLMDPLDWVDGWPTVRGGQWASDSQEHGPAAQPGDATKYRVKLVRDDAPDAPVFGLSDEFDGTALGSQWSWVRPPAAGSYRVGGGNFTFDTQAADLFEGSNNASVLTAVAPADDYVVETRVRVNYPPEGCCFNYVQGGLVIYGDDDNFVKLASVSIWDTRQTEFAKELAPVPSGYPRYGNTVVTAPGDWTYLRIVKRTRVGSELYTAYTSTDGVHWNHGGTWTHALGSARIGLISMGGSGFTSDFDYVRVSTLR